MNDEEIIVSPSVNLYENRPYSRKKFYDEQYVAGESPKMAIHVISVLLFEPDGGIILQKRSDDKRHNSSLIDKTLGGHIKFGDSDDYTTMVEAIQELLTPSVVLENQEDFQKPSSCSGLMWTRLLLFFGKLYDSGGSIRWLIARNITFDLRKLCQEYRKDILAFQEYVKSVFNGV